MMTCLLADYDEDPMGLGSHVRKREDSANGGDPPTAKGLRDNFVGYIDVDTTVTIPLYYTCLMNLDELD